VTSSFRPSGIVVEAAVRWRDVHHHPDGFSKVVRFGDCRSAIAARRLGSSAPSTRAHALAPQTAVSTPGFCLHAVATTAHGGRRDFFLSRPESIEITGIRMFRLMTPEKGEERGEGGASPRFLFSVAVRISSNTEGFLSRPVRVTGDATKPLSRAAKGHSKLSRPRGSRPSSTNSFDEVGNP